MEALTTNMSVDEIVQAVDEVASEHVCTFICDDVVFLSRDQYERLVESERRLRVANAFNLAR